MVTIYKIWSYYVKLMIDNEQRLKQAAKRLSGKRTLLQFIYFYVFFILLIANNVL